MDLQSFCGVFTNAPNQQQGRSVRVNRHRSRRARSSPSDSVGKYASDAWSLAKRTAYGLNEIRKLINIETKAFDVTNVVSPDTSGSVISISSIAQGLDYTNRIGDSIKLQNIAMNIAYQVGTTGTKTTLRITLVRDLDGYGTTPLMSDVYERTPYYMSTVKYLNRERFSILYDEIVTLQSVNEANGITIFAMPHEGHVKYLGTTAAAASNGKGSLYILLSSNESTGTNAPSANYTSRITYTDD